MARASSERDRPLWRLAVDEFHDQVVGSDVVERANVGMVQRSDGARLALETLAELLVRYLDGDVPAQPRVASAVTSPMPPRPTAA